MNFEDLTDKDIKYISEIHGNKQYSWDEKMQLLTRYLGRSERTVRRWLKKLEVSKGLDAIEQSEDFKVARAKVLNNDKRVFFITWAQNATPVHKRFFENLLAYADYRDADVHVIAGRYKNPTSIFTDEKHDWWVSEVLPYLDANRHDLHPLLTLLSDIKVQPTASNPLSGFESVTGFKSAIVGHPKVHFKSEAVLEGHPFKVLATTGACTVPNYTDTKAGAKGEFHHTFGFVIVECQDQDVFHLRQVTANADGSFTDLNKRVENSNIYTQETFPFIVLGDLHPYQIDYNFYNIGVVDFLDKFRPNKTILHDVYDAYSISHHHEKDPILQFKKHKQGLNDAKVEIEKTKELLRPLIKHSPVIVRSNHDDHLDQWIRRADWKKDVINSLNYIEMAAALLHGTADKGLIPYYLHSTFGNDIECLARDDSYKIKDWELAHHGDIGPNGSRGSINNFSKLNIKAVIAHSHSPGRLNGCIQAGTCTKLRVEYNKGASSWRHAHVIGHEDGKAQLILFSRDYKYTTFDD